MSGIIKQQSLIEDDGQCGSGYHDAVKMLTLHNYEALSAGGVIVHGMIDKQTR